MKTTNARTWLAGGALLLLGLLWLWTRGGETRGQRAPEERATASAPSPGVPAAPARAPEAEEASLAAPARTQETAAIASGPAPGLWLRLLGPDRSPVPALDLRIGVLQPDAKPDERPTWAYVRSDDSGWIDLREHLPDGPSTRVLHPLLPDPRRISTPRSFPASRLGRTQAEAVELIVAPSPEVRLAGVARTGEGAPLPSLAFQVVGWRLPPGDGADVPEPGSLLSEWLGVGFPRPQPWIVTREDGSFAAEDTYPPGVLLLRTLHREQTRVVLTAEGTPVEARFRVGPTIRLDFDPPGGRRHEDFVAGLYRSPENAGLEAELVEPASPWAPAQGRSGIDGAPVLAGPPPWTRLPVEEWEHPLPSYLILVSRDGAAKGAARIDDLARHATEPLRVEVEERECLTLRFHHPQGCDDQQVVVVLFAAGGREELGTRWEGRDHQARFQGLAPGPYRIVLTSDPGFERTLEVVVPGADPLDVELPDLRPQGQTVLEGEVVTDSGQSLDGKEGRAMLLITDIFGGRGRGGAPAWEEPGRGRFRLDGLPPGEHRVLVSFQKGAFEVEPRTTRVTLPGPPFTIRVHDGMPQERFELLVRRIPETAELEIEAVSEDRKLRISETLSNNEGVEARADGMRTVGQVLGPYPAGAFQTLRIRAEGRRTRELARGDFRREGDALRIEVDLEDGWSGRFHVLEAGDEPKELEGILLALDGIPLAPSTPEGIVQAEAESKPRLLSVLTPGWRLVEHSSWNDWGTVFPSGEFTVEQGRIDVFLERAP